MTLKSKMADINVSTCFSFQTSPFTWWHQKASPKMSCGNNTRPAATTSIAPETLRPAKPLDPPCASRGTPVRPSVLAPPPPPADNKSVTCVLPTPSVRAAPAAPLEGLSAGGFPVLRPAGQRDISRPAHSPGGIRKQAQRCPVAITQDLLPPPPLHQRL
ncbi:UNVERIFIED_CONTAM: hypothetical protein FKN15_044008 [Acipenser sinensis]